MSVNSVFSPGYEGVVRKFKGAFASDDRIGLLQRCNKTGFYNRQLFLRESQRSHHVHPAGMINGLGLRRNRFGGHQPARNADAVATDIQQGTAGNIPLAAAFAVVPILIMGVLLTIAKRTGAFEAL